MHELLTEKSVLFLDVGYTIDYPASGDWMFTKRFYELAADRMKHCAAEQIRRAKAAGVDYLLKNHLIRSEKEDAERFQHYYRIVSEALGLRLTEDEIKGYILSHMAKHKVPRYIKFVDAFPMNVAGKILKYKMREDAVEKFGLKKAAEIETA